MPTDDSGPASALSLLAGAADTSLLASMPALEAEILEAAQDLDQKRAGEALLCLLEYYEKDVVRYLARRLSEHQILDMWSVIIMRVMRRLRNPPRLVMDGGKPFLAYLYRIAGTLIAGMSADPSSDVASLDQLRDLYSDTLSARSIFSERIPDVEDLNDLNDPDDLNDLEIDAICRDLLPPHIRGKLQSHHAIATPAPDESPAEKIIAGSGYIDPAGCSLVLWELSQLPPQHRACLILGDWFGYSYDIVGDVVGLPRDTAYIRAWSGRKRIRAILAYRWRAEEERGLPQIARDLRIEEHEVPDYIEEGRRLYKREQRQQKRGERDER